MSKPKEKIKILFVNPDQAGVYYFRTMTPALQIDTYHNDEFDIELNQNVDWNNREYLKKFHIIHTHRQFGPFEQNEEFFDFCKKNNIITIMDIDDSPILNIHHPMYNLMKTERLDLKIFDTLKRCDAVTTTTTHFADVLRKYNPNVIDLNNGVNPEIMPQFNFKRKDSDKIRVGWVGGSSHAKDIDQLKSLFQLMSANVDLHDKLTISLHGFDLRGAINNLQPNPNLVTECIGRGISVQDLIKQYSDSNGQLDNINIIPNDLKLKYKDNFIINSNRTITPDESIWTVYENIFTDNYKLIKDEKYVKFLKQFKDEQYENEENQVYRRFFTRKINTYATHYDNVDISLIPLVVNDFNLCKSPLKLVEAQAKRCTVIVSDNPIYTKYIKHGVNGLIAKDERDWSKLVKRLVTNPEMVKDLSAKLIEDTHDEFDLSLITKKRIEFYKQLFNAKNR